MGRWSDFKRLLKTARSGGSAADIGLLKAEIFGVKTPDAVVLRLQRAGLDGYFPELCMPDLRALPPNSLGHAYAAMLDSNGLSPFRLSPDLRARAMRHTYIMRYIATHDFIHVVTGFGTDYPGELGVLAATVEQGFAPGGAIQEWSARLYYPLRLWPGRWSELRAARRRGHDLGAQAGDLLTFRYEDAVGMPLGEIRRVLGLEF